MGAQLAHVYATQLVPEDVDDAVGGVCERAEQAQQSALTSAVGAEQYPVLAAVDVKGDVAQQISAISDEIDVLGAEDVRGVGDCRGHLGESTGVSMSDVVDSNKCSLMLGAQAMAAKRSELVGTWF